MLLQHFKSSPIIAIVGRKAYDYNVQTEWKINQLKNNALFTCQKIKSFLIFKKIKITANGNLYGVVR